MPRGCATYAAAAGVCQLSPRAWRKQSARHLGGGRTTEGVVRVEERPGVNAARRVVKVALLDDAWRSRVRRRGRFDGRPRAPPLAVTPMPLGDRGTSGRRGGRTGTSRRFVAGPARRTRWLPAGSGPLRNGRRRSVLAAGAKTKADGTETCVWRQVRLSPRRSAPGWAAAESASGSWWAARACSVW